MRGDLSGSPLSISAASRDGDCRIELLAWTQGFVPGRFKWVTAGGSWPARANCTHENGSDAVRTATVAAGYMGTVKATV